MDNCLFCSIIAGSIPSTKVYEDDLTYAFRDIHPMAKTHVLVVPKTHVASVRDTADVPDEVLAACLRQWWQTSVMCQESSRCTGTGQW